MSNNSPIFSIRDRLLSASCFRKTYTREDGSYGVLYSVCLQRAYKKKGESEYTREQINLTPDDLLKLARLCTTAYGKTVDAAALDRPAKADHPAQEMSLVDDDLPF